MTSQSSIMESLSSSLNINTISKLLDECKNKPKYPPAKYILKGLFGYCASHEISEWKKLFERDSEEFKELYKLGDFGEYFHRQFSIDNPTTTKPTQSIVLRAVQTFISYRIEIPKRQGKIEFIHRFGDLFSATLVKIFDSRVFEKSPSKQFRKEYLPDFVLLAYEETKKNYPIFRKRLMLSNEFISEFGLIYARIEGPDALDITDETDEEGEFKIAQIPSVETINFKNKLSSDSDTLCAETKTKMLAKYNDLKRIVSDYIDIKKQEKNKIKSYTQKLEEFNATRLLMEEEMINAHIITQIRKILGNENFEEDYMCILKLIHILKNFAMEHNLTMHEAIINTFTEDFRLENIEVENFTAKDLIEAPILPLEVDVFVEKNNKKKYQEEKNTIIDEALNKANLMEDFMNDEIRAKEDNLNKEIYSNNAGSDIGQETFEQGSKSQSVPLPLNKNFNLSDVSDEESLSNDEKMANKVIEKPDEIPKTSTCIRDKKKPKKRPASALVKDAKKSKILLRKKSKIVSVVNPAQVFKSSTSGNDTKIQVLVNDRIFIPPPNAENTITFEKNLNSAEMPKPHEVAQGLNKPFVRLMDDSMFKQ